MVDKLPTVKNLIRHLQQVPFIASKNIYKTASYFLNLEQEKIDQFCKMLQEAKKNVVLCHYCFVWKEKNQACLFCDDQNRNKKIICVVETWQELLVIERTESFNGLYHVLGGVISPLEGISPRDLTIEELISRIKDPVIEVVFALNQTPEGEATAAFIARKIQRAGSVKISCLAKGIPIGSQLEFIDRITMGKAFVDRKPF